MPDSLAMLLLHVEGHEQLAETMRSDAPPPSQELRFKESSMLFEEYDLRGIQSFCKIDVGAAHLGPPFSRRSPLRTHFILGVKSEGM